jgi:adenylosuccinate synthase
MKCSVVIGANYGDEGKGLMTDYLCRLHKADLVIRFNGGSQAGHTVVTPEGQRHVFGHIGSGYFANVPTYLSKYFILNPITFRKEYEELGVRKDYEIIIDSDSMVTTYWDMLANRFIEKIMGDTAHNSCGLGIYETITRSKGLQCTNLKIFDAMDKEKLETVCQYWHVKMEILLESYGKGRILPEWVESAFEKKRRDEINSKYIEDVYFMYNHVSIAPNGINYNDYNYAIFEGAQGLGLDQFMGKYPFITSSNTGLRNVIELHRDKCYYGGANFEIDEVVYVSRTYETRHGNDRFLNAQENFPPNIIDKTNFYNEWQGEFKYNDLSFVDLANRIELDIASVGMKDYIKRAIAFTHCDEKNIEVERIFDILEIPRRYKSYGETYKDVKIV